MSVAQQASVRQWIGRVLLYLPLVIGMAANGFLLLAWFLSPPSPDRIGYWFVSIFFVLPSLGVVGLIIVGFTRSLCVSGPLLLYVLLAWGSIFFGNVFTGLYHIVSVEWFQVLLYIGALIWFSIVASRWFGSRHITAT